MTCRDKRFVVIVTDMDIIEAKKIATVAKS